MIVIKLINILAPVNAALAVGFRWLSWTFMAAMTAIVVMQVFFRYVLNNSLTWSEDVSLMMMIWVAFAVAPIAYRSGANVALDTVARLLSGRASFVLNFLIHVLIMLMLAVLINEALEMIGRSRIRANTVPIQMKYIYMIMPVGFGAMFLVGLELALRSLVGVLRPDDALARLPSDTDKMQQVQAE